VLEALRQADQIALRYVDCQGRPGGYPVNPNGSVENIAGICDRSGRIFGMMPHPEAFNIVENCPWWVKGVIKEPMGLRLFKNAVEHAERSGI
jgi:phosphoribosylformylglycinamidine synthase